MKLKGKFISGVLATLIASQVSLGAAEYTTGLDQIIEIIQTDKRLNKRVSQEAIQDASNSASDMNDIIIGAIIENGLANDGLISTADTRELNDYIFENHADVWKDLHGDDEDGVETGYHQVQNNGARTKLFGRNALNRVADDIYHLGFETHRKNKLLNEDGNKNRSFKKVGIWLNGLLEKDLAEGTLVNETVSEIVGETNTGLDQVIDIIYTDERLNKKISTGDMREAAYSANELNKLLIEAIQQTNTAEDGEFTKADVIAINKYLVDNYADIWHELHGDDETNEETGYHLVQNDGAKTKLFGKNAMNNVMDSIYHLGYETTYKNRLVNEDGNKNKRFKRIASWLNMLLIDDFNNGVI